MTGAVSTSRRGARLTRLPLHLAPDERRVILLPFGASNASQASRIFRLVEEWSEERVESTLAAVARSFNRRHTNFLERLEENYSIAARVVGRGDGLSAARRRLIGAYLTMEYSFEAAALFNPSMVPHVDQSQVPDGGVRFILSLRATGEGHVSSIVFRTGIIDGQHRVRLDPLGSLAARAQLAPDQHFLKPLFGRKLREMGVLTAIADCVLDLLGEEFTLGELDQAAATVRRRGGNVLQIERALEHIMWLAHSNYQLQLAPQASIAGLIIYPHSENESRGMEDLRLVRFVDDDGAVTFYGTYTALSGERLLPMLIETKDFRRIQIHTLNGASVQNKGLALFPRRIDGHYCMCSRIDGRNLFLMFSDYVHFWESARLLASPKYPWESRLIGNCGSPLETPEGWLLMTHGVGPMRRYSIGAMLLDRDDPFRIRGRLGEPLLAPTAGEREGYVPNVIYSCGSMIHDGVLYLPYAMSDTATTMATMPLDALLDRLLKDGP